MAKSYEEMKGRSSGRNGTGEGSTGAKDNDNSYLTFWPTEAEKKVLAADERSLLDLMDTLQAHVERGLAFKLGQAKDRTSLYLTCREAAAPFGEGQTIAVFHTSVQRLVLAMVYCLDVKWADFPEKVKPSQQASFDW